MCNKGFKHSEQDPKKCDDIDECQSWDTCSNQICINEKGGFQCECPETHQLSVDGKVCKAKGDPMMQFYVKEDKIMRIIDTPTFYRDAETVQNVKSL